MLCFFLAMSLAAGRALVAWARDGWSNQGFSFLCKRRLLMRGGKVEEPPERSEWWISRMDMEKIVGLEDQRKGLTFSCGLVARGHVRTALTAEQLPESKKQSLILFLSPDWREGTWNPRLRKQ